jgi:myo-inositol 2-dehydrogenase/D-chiro-inositol 1-dehydrogenase
MSGSAADAKAATRREFLRTTGTTVAASAWAAALPIELVAHPGGSDVLKIGLIGCGGRGCGAVRDVVATGFPVKLVAMADAFQEEVDKALEERLVGDELRGKIDVPPERRFAGLDAYEKLLQTDVDYVILAEPPGFRPRHLAAAIAAGKHVFAEKPLATDAPGVRQVLAAAAEAKKKGLGLGVGLQRRHQNDYIETIKRLQDGAIGEILFMRAYWNGAGVWVRHRRPGMTEMQYQVWNWYYFTWLSGDHIVEQHIHNLDVINWLKGAYPVKCQGQGGRQVRTGKEYGQIYDHHFVEYHYPDGSVLLSQCRHIPGCWNSVSEHAHGTKGYAEISAARILPREGERWRYRGERNNPYVQEHYDLIQSILSGNPINEGEYGAYSTLTAIMGRMATYTGQEVTWEEALNSNESLQPKEYRWDAEPPVKPDANGFYPVPMPGQTTKA